MISASLRFAESMTEKEADVTAKFEKEADVTEKEADMIGANNAMIKPGAENGEKELGESGGEKELPLLASPSDL